MFFVCLFVFEQRKIDNDMSLQRVKCLQQFIGRRQIVIETKYSVGLNYLSGAPRGAVNEYQITNTKKIKHEIILGPLRRQIHTYTLPS